MGRRTADPFAYPDDHVSPEMPCNVTDCPNTFKADKWNSIKAHEAGWYMQKNGTNWCPDHRPVFAPTTWRGKK